jgi:hypothetical protein
MNRQRIATLTYVSQLRNSIRDWLPTRSLPLIDGVRWSDRILAVCAIVWSWAAGSTQAQRFEAARDAVVKMYPSRRRPGKTLAGFMQALVQRSEHLLALLSEHLRQRMERALEGPPGRSGAAGWRIGRWIAFAADSTKLDCPMTRANERELGCASREKSWPQMVLATLVHLGSGLPWSWRLGPACSSERELLVRMLEDLPLHSLLVADAGFVGFDLFKTILACGHSLLIRVGANVHLIEKLGYALEECDGLVYLWPKDGQKRGLSPLVLRKITIVDGRNRRMVLLTNVLDKTLLSDAQAAELYRRRWGIELFYRTLKQTMGRGKMLSDSPRHAEIEGNWMMLGLWMLGLILLEHKPAEAPAQSQSVAQALHAVRDAMAGRIRPGHRKLERVLRLALKDAYVRANAKAARHWPHRKNPPPPGEPQARMAEEAEIRLANEMKRLRPAA